MNRLSPSLFLCCLGLFLHLAQQLAIAAEPLNGLAAIVNGKVITRSDVENELIAQRQSIIKEYQGNPEGLKRKIKQLKAEALDALIDRELILSDFEELGGAIKPEFVENQINEIILKRYDNDREKFIADLSRAGLSLKTFRKMQEKKLIAQFMRGNQAKKVEPPTYQEITAYYQKHVSDFREDDFIKLRTLTIPKFTGNAQTSAEDQQKLAQDLHAQLAAGADFANLVKAHSTDSAADSGGDRGWVSPSDISKEIADAAFEVKSGNISEIIETPRAFTILWIEARKKGRQTPLEKLRDTVESRVKAQKGIELEKKWLDRLRRNAVIKKFD